MDDEARRRFKEMPLDEFRRRIDLAVAHLRDLRRGIAASTGMLLEEVDIGMPIVDKEQAELAFQQVMEMLPLTKRLPPEERAKLKPVSAKDREEMEEMIDAMAEMDAEAFDESMKELGLSYTHADMIQLQEEGEKIRLLGLVQEETEALIPALEELKKRIGERAQNVLGVALARAARKGSGSSGAAN